MSLKFFKKYEDKWKIYVPANPTEFESIVTPSFSPLPDYDITFRFEARYQEIRYEDTHLYLFKLKLVKLIRDRASPTSEVSVDVRVNYLNGSQFMDYPSQSFRNINVMDVVTFKDAVSPCDHVHHNRMPSGTLIIKCVMTFSDQHQSLIASEIEIKSSKYADFIENLKSLYEPGVLSDFTFKVGDRSFSVHKAILAAHSPVFMKMMTQEFLESKTNTVTITDATPEIIDSFLKSVYSGEIGDTSLDSLKELYCLADKYDVGFLKKKCTPLIISFLSVDSVCEMLIWAYSYTVSDVKTAAMNFAFDHIKEIASRDDWNELVKTQPMIGYEVLANFIPKKVLCFVPTHLSL